MTLLAPETGSWWRQRAACADPELLPLVDAAFDRPGGPEGQQLRDGVCRHCPVNQQCYAEAMTNPEPGVWGGTSPKVRSQRGARAWRVAISAERRTITV